jgi:hypothetical protein
MPGIWLSDDELRSSEGAIWLQQQQQRVQAGQSWAGEQLARLQQQAAQQVAALAPSPVAAPPPVPAPAPPPAPPPVPAPVAPPPVVPIGGAPTGAVGAPVPGDLTTAGIAPPAPAQTPPTPTVPTPAPAQTPSVADVGQSWAQEQIQNLLNPSAQTPSSTPAPQPIPGMAAPPLPGAAPSPPPATQPVAPPPSQSSTPQAGTASSAPPDRSMSYQDYAKAAAARAGIDPNVFTAQIQQESGFNPTAKSPAGAIGIAQFMPATAAGVNLDPTDPYASLDAAAKEDAARLKQYGGDWGKTLASYNAGAGAVEQYGGIPPYAETQSYVKTIMGNAQKAADAAGTTISGLVQQGVDVAQGAISKGQTAVNTAVQGAQSAVARTSQFAMGLSSGDAYSFCGPAAAIAFADTYGRNPTVAEAKQLAQQVGWNSDQGMAGVQSEVKLLGAMGVDAHMTSGVDWASVGRDASGGNPVIIDTPGHYYYVDGYNAQTGQLHVGTSGTDLKGGSDWMTPDQINKMPQSGGGARAAIFADHPLAQSDGLAQSTAASTKATSPQGGQTFMGGLQDAAGNVLANAPVPFVGGRFGQLGDLLGQNQQSLQQGRDLVGSILSPDLNAPAPLRAKADSILQSVQDVGGQAGQASQNLLQQGQNLLQGVQQAPQTVNDLLNQNALFSQGIPNIGGNLLEGAGNLAGQGQQALGNLNDVLSNPQQMYANSPTAAFNRNLQGLGQDVLAPVLNSAADALNPSVTPEAPLGRGADWLSQQNVPLLSGAADVLGPTLKQGGALDATYVTDALAQKYGTSDSSQYSSEDQQRLSQARMAVGGISTADWGKGFYRGGIISSPATMADIAMNSGAGPIVSTVTGALGDVLHGTAAPGRLTGRALGTASGIGQWAGQFLDALRPSAASPSSLVGRATPGIERGAAYAAEGWGMTHGAFQQATQNLIQQQELGAAAGQAASKVGSIGTAAWRAAYDAFMTSPPADAVAAAQAEGARVAARAAPGWLTGKLGQLAGGGAGGQNWLQTALFPVYRMGMNLATRAVEASPAGLVGTAIDVARGMLGQGPYAAGLLSQPATNTVAPLARRLMTNALGTALTAFLVKEGMEGNINGSWAGRTPAEQDDLRAQGMAPDTFRGPDGKWYGWDKAPPQLRGALIAAGAYVDAAHAYQNAQNTRESSGSQAYGLEDPRTAAARTLFNEVGTQLANTTPLRTFASTYDMFTGGGQQDLRSLTDIPSSILGGVVPESGLLRGVSQMTDPYQRQVLQPKTTDQVVPAILQNVQQNLPGLREQLPSRLDVLGRDVVNPVQGLSAILPLRAAAGEPNPILGALANTGVAPSSAPTSIPYGPSTINLRPDEQQTYIRERGQLIQQMASELVNSPSFAQMPDYAQKIALQRVTQVAGEVAGKMLLASMGNPNQRMSAQGVLGPVQSYALPNSLDQATQQHNQAMHQALMQSLLGGQSGTQSIMAANQAALGAV